MSGLRNANELSLLLLEALYSIASGKLNPRRMFPPEVKRSIVCVSGFPPAEAPIIGLNRVHFPGFHRVGLGKTDFNGIASQIATQ